MSQPPVPAVVPLPQTIQPTVGDIGVGLTGGLLLIQAFTGFCRLDMLIPLITLTMIVIGRIIVMVEISGSRGRNS